MPTVPSSFVPGVSQNTTGAQSAAAPNVAPMRNYAPEQISEMGGALSQAGSVAMRTGQNVSMRVQETVDDANVKKAETAFLQNATGAVTDYTHKLGNDAIEGYDPAAAAVAKAKQDALGGLTNDIQRKMFGYVANQHLVNFGRQMADHKYQQTVTYGVQAANDRADSFVQIGANAYADWQRPDGDFAKNKKLAIQEAQNAASLSGAPPDSPQSKAMVKQKLTALTQGVLARMMDNEQYDEAKTYYDKALQDGEIDERAAEQLGNIVLEGHVSAKGKDLASQAKQIALGGDSAQQRIQPVAGGSITSVMGAPRPGGRTHDGVDVSVPVGTKIQAPANGTVSKVWNDDKFGGGLSMEVTYPNGSTEGFAHLSAANYQPGQQVTQGAVLGLTGKSGNATGPVLHWAMKDKDGNWTDPRAASSAPKNPAEFTDPDTLGKAIDFVNSSDQTERVKSVAIANLHSQYDLARDMDNQKYQKVKQQVTDYYFTHNESIDGLPGELRSALKPKDLYDFSKQGDKQTDLSTWYGFVTNPTTLTVSNVQSAYVRGQLDKGDFRSLTERAMSLQKAGEPGVLEANAVTDRIKFYANQSGVKVYGAQSEDDKVKMGTLTFKVMQDIDRIKQQNNGKATSAQVDEAIKAELTQRTLSQPRSPFNPLAIFGHPLATSQKYTFEMPDQSQVEQWGRDANGNPVRTK